MVDVILGTAIFAAAIVYASFFEWALHRFLLHRPLSFFDYPFRTHTLTHHHIFNAFDAYHLQEEKHKDKVTFSWWNAPILIGLHLPALFFLQKTAEFPVFWPGLAALIAYYTAYETLHWLMHVPKQRWIEKTAAFRFLNRHHRLHHLFQYKNFNVVLPLADVVFQSRIGKREDAYIRRKLRGGDRVSNLPSRSTGPAALHTKSAVENTGRR